MSTGNPAAQLSASSKAGQAIWGTGDFAVVGTMLVPVSEQLCETLRLKADQRVLDVATGSGNTAIAAARRQCVVTGVDFVPALLERARERAAVERLVIDFQEADAQALPFPDASFDVVLSTFGVIFAPDQELAARELLRVCRPGGKIGLTNWTPEGSFAAQFQAFATYLPPDPAVRQPAEWGTERRLYELFGDSIAGLHATRRHFYWSMPSVDAWLQLARQHLGPIITAFAALDPAKQAQLSDDLRAVMLRYNQSGDDTLLVPQEYLEVVLIKR